MPPVGQNETVQSWDNTYAVPPVGQNETVKSLDNTNVVPPMGLKVLVKPPWVKSNVIPAPGPREQGKSARVIDLKSGRTRKLLFRKGIPGQRPATPNEIVKPPTQEDPDSQSVVVLVQSRTSVFANWDSYLNEALMYNHDRVLPFVLYMCLSESQKYGRDLISASSVVVACKDELKFETGTTKINWNSLFIANPN